MPTGPTVQITENQCDELIGHLLHRANQQVNRLFMFNGAASATWRQYVVLLAVQQCHQPNQTEIVQLTGIDRSTLADMIARMIAKGLISRVRARNDARANLLSLTRKGQQSLRGLHEQANEVEVQLRAMIPASALRSFIRSLSAISLTPVHDESKNGSGEHGEQASKVKKSQHGVRPKARKSKAMAASPRSPRRTPARAAVLSG